MICPSVPIPASTELTKFCIFRVAKNTALPFGAPYCWRYGGICHEICRHPLPAATTIHSVQSSAESFYTTELICNCEL